jgi:uncharacterized membrane protein YfcA
MDHNLPFVIAILAFGAFVQGVAGFAFALVSLPFLTFFMEIRTAVPLIALCGMIINLLLFIPLRRHVRAAMLITLMAGAVPGIPAGTLFLKQAPEEGLRLMLGIILCAYGTWGLLKPSTDFRLSDAWGILFGFMAGALGAALNTSGPPVIVYVSLKGWTKDRIKGTLQAFFGVLNILVIIWFLYNGVITGKTCSDFLLTAPGVLAGLFLGHTLYSRINDILYARILNLLLLCCGIMFIWRVI